jgi:hypothetical protein
MRIKGAPELTSLDLFGTTLNNDVIEVVSSLRSLTFLCLSDTNLTDAWLARLENLVSLRELDLSRTRISDEALSSLLGMKQLKILNLDGTGATDAGLQQFGTLPRLRQLRLDRTEVTDHGALRLKKLLPKCKIVRKRDLDPNRFRAANLSHAPKTAESGASVPRLPSLRLVSAEGKAVTLISDDDLLEYFWPAHALVLRPGVVGRLAAGLSGRTNLGFRVKLVVNGLVCWRGEIVDAGTAGWDQGVLIDIGPVGRAENFN